MRRDVILAALAAATLCAGASRAIASSTGDPKGSPSVTSLSVVPAPGRAEVVIAIEGLVDVVDFTLDSPRGPPRQHKLAPETVLAELAQAGFALVKQHEGLPDQYLLELSPTP